MSAASKNALVKIGVLGADGRMGKTVIAALEGHKRAQLCAAITAPGSPNLGKDAGAVAGLRPNGITLTDNAEAALQNCDALIDFSHPKAAIDTALAMHGAPCQTFVTGTTGYAETDEAALMAAAHDITLLKSGNFSLGVNLLEVLTEKTAAALGEDWDIEILDMHHKNKVDAPSGTALMLGEAAAKGRGKPLADLRAPLREVSNAPRTLGEIGFASIRSGDIIGKHDVRIGSDMEMITLSHEAFDRRVFAQGAVVAALWAVEQPKGFYTMRDVLGL